MDRGMTLQLAGQYQQSNDVLEQAEEEIDRLYTRHIRTESLAFMTNDNSLPFEGDPYEQVMINVLKALNYASLNQWQDALVEAGHEVVVASDTQSALDALEADHQFLLKGDVFTEELLRTYIDYKRTKEVQAVKLRPHPYEFALYYDI